MSPSTPPRRPARRRRPCLFALLVAVALVTAARADDRGGPPRAGMSLGQAAVLGLIEGLTEYLPVSSTGHLLLAQRLMKLPAHPDEKAAADAYAICIQAGAILAVALLYWRRLLAIAQGLMGRDRAGLRLGVHLIVAFLPAAVAGVLLEGTVKRLLFGNGAWGMWPWVGAWLAGGIVILVVERWRAGGVQRQGRRALSDLTWPLALAIGLAQCVAMWPGVSRSLAAIVGGLLAGLALPAAVEFSFLLGLITLTAATAHDVLRHGGDIAVMYGLGAPLVGFVVALLSAAAAVRWMVTYLQRHPMSVFGWYRIALAAVVAGFLLWG